MQELKKRLKNLNAFDYFLICIFLCVFILCLNPVSALSSLKTNTNFSLIVTSNNATECNLTAIQYPNGTSNLFNIILSKSGQTFSYNVDSSNYSQAGLVCHSLVCYDGVTYATGSVCVNVTATGSDMNTSKALSYILIFIVALMIFAGLTYLGLTLPSGNKRDELYGYVIAVSNLKYLKMVLLGLAYLSLVFISYLTYIICYAYLDLGFLTQMFYIIFVTISWGTIIAYALLIYFVIASFINDNKIKDYLMRGINIK